MREGRAKAIYIFTISFDRKKTGSGRCPGQPPNRRTAARRRRKTAAAAAAAAAAMHAGPMMPATASAFPDPVETGTPARLLPTRMT